MIKFGKRIPIAIHPIFWLTAGIIGWINSWNFMGTLIWVFIILVSILIHEFGHALTSKMFGQEAQIELVALGGLTYHDGKKLKKWQDFIIVLMGPVFGLILAGVAYLIRSGVSQTAPGYVLYMLSLFVIVNIFWTIVNLLPILPLDGGQLLRIILEGIFGHKGIKYTLFIGIVLAVSIGVYAFIYGLFLIGAILLLLAFEGLASYKQVKNMTSVDQDQETQKMLEEAQANLQLGRFDIAKEKLEALRNKAKEGLLFNTATEQLAFLYEKEGQMNKTYELLKPIAKRLSSNGKCLLHRAAYYNKDYQLTISLGSVCFQERPVYEIAYINALASACTQDVTACIGWLECAVKHGMPNLKGAIEKPEFDLIRENENFKTFINSH